MREKFDLRLRALDRRAVALHGSSLEHIAPALESLRAEPFAAAVRARRSDARSPSPPMPPQLAIVMFGSALRPMLGMRETDAAARAFVAGDPLPLLRLMAETLRRGRLA